MSETLVEHWNKEAQARLVGRTIVAVSYTSAQEVESFGWYARGLSLELDDGTLLILSQDDEGNGPGALFGENGVESFRLPVIDENIADREWKGGRRGA